MKPLKWEFEEREDGVYIADRRKYRSDLIGPFASLREAVNYSLVEFSAPDPCPWPRFRLWGRNQ